MTDWRVPLCIDGAEIQELRDIAKRATDELLLARKVVEAARNMLGPKSIQLKMAIKAYDEGEK